MDKQLSEAIREVKRTIQQEGNNNWEDVVLDKKRFMAYLADIVPNMTDRRNAINTLYEKYIVDDLYQTLKSGKKQLSHVDKSRYVQILHNSFYMETKSAQNLIEEFWLGISEGEAVSSDIDKSTEQQKLKNEEQKVAEKYDEKEDLIKGEKKVEKIQKNEISKNNDNKSITLLLDDWLEKANKGDREAQYQVGEYYYRKRRKKYYADAYGWYLQAAEQGHEGALEMRDKLENKNRIFQSISSISPQDIGERQYFLARLYKYGTVDIEKDANKYVEWLLKAAVSGNASAQYDVGFLYRYGLDNIVVPNEIKAFEWYEKAAMRGNSNAKAALATRDAKMEKEKAQRAAAMRKVAGTNNSHTPKISRQPNYSTNPTIDTYLARANMGDVPSQYYVARCYRNGFGVPIDYEKSYEWYLKAANAGYAEAQYQMGVIYDPVGGMLGKTKDPLVAKKWYQKAADQGLESAKLALAKIEKTESQKANDNTQKAKVNLTQAKQGDAIAAFKVGEMLRLGREVEKDEKLAFEWYEKSANLGCVEAMFQLAECYHFGEGVSQNEKTAQVWYEKSLDEGLESKLKERANAGDAEAQYQMGRLCIQKSVKASHVRSIELEEKARQWYEKASSQNHAKALYFMGYIYEYGYYGAKKRRLHARKFHKKSVQMGFEYAKDSIRINTIYICYDIILWGYLIGIPLFVVGVLGGIVLLINRLIGELIGVSMRVSYVGKICIGTAGIAGTVLCLIYILWICVIDKLMPKRDVW